MQASRSHVLRGLGLCLLLAGPGCGQDEAPTPGAEFPGRWSAPEAIGVVPPDNFGPLDHVDVALDPSGTAVALWLQPKPVAQARSNGTLWWSRSNGAAWTPPEPLDERILGFDLAFGPNGDGAVIWTRISPGGAHRNPVFELLSSRLSPGGRWGGFVPVTQFDNLEVFTGYQGRAGLAVDASGTALSVWMDRPDRVISGASFWPAGLRWLPPVRLAEDDGLLFCLKVNRNDAFRDSAMDSRVGFDGAGNAIAVWLLGEEIDGVCPMHLWSSRYDRASGWSAPTLVARSPGQAQRINSYVNLAVGVSGSAATIQLQSGSGDPAVVANRYDPGTGWTEPAVLSFTKANARPGIAMTDDGEALALWNGVRTGDNERGIICARSASGQGWTQELVAPLSLDEATTAPGIAADAAGRALAVWRQADGAVYRIAAAYREDGRWSRPVFLSTNQMGVLADRPVLAMTRQGRALLVWQQSRPIEGVPEPEISLWSSRYEPAYAAP